MDDAHKSSLLGIGLAAPPPSPVVPTGDSSSVPDQPDTDRTMAKVAARQWEADRKVRQQTEQVPRSEQVGDRHVYHWFNDAAIHSALRHFPELMRLKSGAATRLEHTTNLGEGGHYSPGYAGHLEGVPIGCELPCQGRSVPHRADGWLHIHDR